MPLWLRKFVTDTVESGLAALLALTIVWPRSWEDLQAQGVIVAAALVGALISAFRRAVPEMIAWLRERLGVDGLDATDGGTD